MNGKYKKNVSNLYKTTTPWTTQKRLSWADDCLIKHLYKTQTKSGCSWQVFSFCSHCEYFINSKRFVGIKMCNFVCFGAILDN